MAVAAATFATTTLAAAPGRSVSGLSGEPMIQHVGSLLTGGYMGIAFSRTSHYAYANSSRGIDVIDIRDPIRPRVVGSVALPDGYMEDINVGERKHGTTWTRFVLVDAPEVHDLRTAQTATAVHVIDVSDPENPYRRSSVASQPREYFEARVLGEHTVTCLTRTCEYAYGSSGVYDLSDLDNPSQVGLVPWEIGRPHAWNADAAGLMWLSGEHGIAAYNVTTPNAPVLVNAGDHNAGRTSKYNDKLQLHGSLRPHADRFKSNAQPAYENGNVLFVSEEGNDVDCTDGFQTWWVPTLDAAFQPTWDSTFPGVARGTVTPLDYWSLEEDVGMAPNGEMCSVHWFDFHKRGFVVVPTYGNGTRILNVRNPRRISQVGAAVTAGNQAVASYWLDERRSSVTIESDTAIVYTADAVRGIDVFKVRFPE